MWYELYINKNLDLGIIFDVSLLSKKGNLCNTHFTSSPSLKFKRPRLRTLFFQEFEFFTLTYVEESFKAIPLLTTEQLKTE